MCLLESNFLICVSCVIKHRCATGVLAALVTENFQLRASIGVKHACIHTYVI
jgi:hypothetical protein